MAQEYFINDETLQSKIRDLLPSQGGLGAGFDLSASTQIVPIVDLTESAEGSNVRQDLQTAFGYNNSNSFDLVNVTKQDIITNTGYYKIQGYCNIQSSTSATKTASLLFYDGSTYKSLVEFRSWSTTDQLSVNIPFNYTLFLSAGKSLVADVATNVQLIGSFRQIANIDGQLTPLT